MDFSRNEPTASRTCRGYHAVLIAYTNEKNGLLKPAGQLKLVGKPKQSRLVKVAAKYLHAYRKPAAR